MTLGEKIRYFRTRMGITQGKLAELSGIHPVSIRKYEANKMIPQTNQIEKIAEALGVSSLALTGIENNFRLKTVGDFISLFIELYKCGIIQINGERGEDMTLKADSIKFKLNPLISKLFSFKTDDKEIDLDKLICNIKSDSILKGILAWEKVSYGYRCMAEKYGSEENPLVQETLEQMYNDIEMIELELSCLKVIPTDGDEIKVMIPPDYFAKK